MNTVRLEFSQFGHFESFDVFRHSEPMLVDSLPEPVATGLKTMFYVDSNVEDGDNYYRVRVNRDEGSLVSEEMYIRVTNEWSFYSLNPTFVLNTDSMGVLSSSEAALLNKGSLGGVITHVNGYGLPTINNGRYVFNRSESDRLRIHVDHDPFRGVSIFWALMVINPYAKYPGEQPFFIGLTSYPLGYASRVGFAVMPQDDGRTLRLLWRTTTDGQSYNITHKITFGELQMVLMGFNLNTGETIVSTDGLTKIKGTTAARGQTTSDPARDIAIGSSFDLASMSYFNGEIASIVTTDKELTAVELLKLFGETAHRYGLQSQLPDNHPYKWVKPIVAEDNKPYGLFVEMETYRVMLKFGVAGLFDAVDIYRTEQPLVNTSNVTPILSDVAMTGVLVANPPIKDTYLTVVAKNDGVESIGESTLLPKALDVSGSYTDFTKDLDDELGGSWIPSGGASITGGVLKMLRASKQFAYREYNERWHFPGTEDVTIRGLLKTAPFSSDRRVFATTRFDTTGKVSNWVVYLAVNTVQLNIWRGVTLDSGMAVEHAWSVPIPFNEEFELSVERKDMQWRVYLNGVQYGAAVTQTSAYTPDTTAPITLGSEYKSTNPPAPSGNNRDLDGHIRYFQLLKGVALGNGEANTPRIVTVPSRGD